MQRHKSFRVNQSSSDRITAKMVNQRSAIRTEKEIASESENEIAFRNLNFAKVTAANGVPSSAATKAGIHIECSGFQGEKAEETISTSSELAANMTSQRTEYPLKRRKEQRSIRGRNNEKTPSAQSHRELKAHQSAQVEGPSRTQNRYPD
jgi:hypothetical protein